MSYILLSFLHSKNFYIDVLIVRKRNTYGKVLAVKTNKTIETDKMCIPVLCFVSF